MSRRTELLSAVSPAVLLAVSTVGCGTILSRTEVGSPDWDTTVYGGTKLDALMMVGGGAAAFSGNEGGIAFLLVPFGLIDLPLSLVADTVLLPWTIPEQFGSRREDFHALVAAIEAGDVARARTIAEAAPGLLHGKAGSQESGGSNWQYRTPLHLAVAKGQLDLVEWIASEVARDNAEDSSGETPLIQALRADRADLVRILLKHGADPNHRMQDSIPDWTPLHCAAAQKDPALAKALLDRGALVEARTERKDTPLHVAAEKDHASVAALLLARGADVNAKGHRGATPLHAAAGEGSLAVARVLLSHGADINARREDWNGGWLGISEEKGTTPLGEAMRWKHARMVALLRSKGGVE